MKKLFFIFSFCCALALSFSSCVKEKSVGEGDDLEFVKLGDRVPEFSVYNNAGRQDFNISSFTGRKTLIVLYSVTCSDCRQQMPVIDEVWNELRGVNGYRILALAREGGADLSKEYCYDDAGRAAYNKFATKWVPRLYVVDETGRITWTYKGVANKSTIFARLGYYQNV